MINNKRSIGLLIKTMVVIIIALFVIPGLGFADNAKVWTAQTPIHINPGATNAKPTGYSPANITAAYGIDQLKDNGGAGTTIAIVDAYGSPTIQSDLNQFCSQYNLPMTTIQVVKQPGLKSTNAGWALETSLDVEWAHAMAPNANIMLVEAKSASLSDLLWAVDYASNNGATVVSMSWGSNEFSSESSYDSHFAHAGVTYVASSGDSGAGVEWPAVSPNVVAVGGTTLTISSNSYVSETAWSGSGGGVSAYVSVPSYQVTAPNFAYSMRSVPDVAFVADPGTGLSVYDSTKYTGRSGWFVVGGTSAGAPAWAGLLARASGSSNTLLYSQASTSSSYQSNYHDITAGSNGYSAKAGYDLVTGLGSPIANKLVAKL